MWLIVIIFLFLNIMILVRVHVLVKYFEKYTNKYDEKVYKLTRLRNRCIFSENEFQKTLKICNKLIEQEELQEDKETLLRLKEIGILTDEECAEKLKLINDIQDKKKKNSFNDTI